MTALRTPSPRDQLPADARYECLVKVASGGMATVYVGRSRGLHGFSRLVAIKRAHAHLAEDPELRRAMIAEAKLASQLHHPNVVGVLDIDEPRDELLLVMDYVEGASLAQLAAAADTRGVALDAAVVVRIALDVAAGLEAAHHLRRADGQPLHIVHRDVSPQNVLVGVDGSSRIADFGIAKWSEATHATAAGLKGKFAYMAPEYIATRAIDRRGDVFALGVTIWEALTNRRLFRAGDEIECMKLVVSHEPAPPSEIARGVPAALDPVIARALAKDPSARYGSAGAFARDLEEAARVAGLTPSHEAVGALVRDLFGDVLEGRRRALHGLIASGERTGAALGGAPGGEVTQTAAGALTMSDARTLNWAASSGLALPVEGRGRPRDGARPRTVALVALAAAAAVSGLVMLERWITREPPAAPRGASADFASTAAAGRPAPEVQAAAGEAARHVLEVAPPGEPGSAGGPAPSSSASATRHVAAPTSRSKPASARPTAASRPGRPGLGY